VAALTFQLCYGIEQSVGKDQAVFNVDEMPKFEGKDLAYFRAWVQHNIRRPKPPKRRISQVEFSSLSSLNAMVRYRTFRLFNR
jgi:hypothetical protein